MILVTGANGVVGTPLIQRLREQQTEFISVSRAAAGNQIQWNLEQPLAKPIAKQIHGCSQLIHCAPIWLLAPHIAKLKQVGIRRLVVFSSTSVLSKQNSSSPQEQRLVRNLAQAEQQIQADCQHNDIVFTILRPSMIYGHQRDQNVTHIARFIQRWHFVPLVGRASGGRQPVHADDLVSAALECLQNERAVNQVYTLAGGQVMTYREMVLAIFRGLNRSARIVTVPLFLFRLLLRAMRILGRFDYTPEMADRMNQDLVYSNDAAIADLGYSPQSFLEQPERDLP